MSLTRVPRQPASLAPGAPQPAFSRPGCPSACVSRPGSPSACVSHPGPSPQPASRTRVRPLSLRLSPGSLSACVSHPGSVLQPVCRPISWVWGPLGCQCPPSALLSSPPSSSSCLETTLVAASLRGPSCERRSSSGMAGQGSSGGGVSAGPMLPPSGVSSLYLEAGAATPARLPGVPVISTEGLLGWILGPDLQPSPPEIVGRHKLANPWGHWRPADLNSTPCLNEGQMGTRALTTPSRWRWAPKDGRYSSAQP